MSTAPVSSDEQVKRQSWFASGPAFVWYIAGSLTLLHLLTANRYGYFGDELYFMACGEHLAWGYVDQPPLIALAAWFTRHVFGTSVFAVHLLPAMAGLVLVWLTGVITRELGGGRFSQALAALCTACAGVYLVTHHTLSTNESQTSRKLAQQQEEITSTLGKASVQQPEDLLRRFEERDKLVDRLTAGAARLQVALESKPLEEWSGSMTGLDAQLAELSDRIAKLGAARAISEIEADLRITQKKLKQLSDGTVQAQTQIEEFTRRQATLRERILGRENRLATLESEIVRLLKRAGRENEAGLNALEKAYQGNLAKLSAIQAKKAQILKGRLETHIYTLHTTQEQRALTLRQELERLAPDAMPEEQLRELGAGIEGLEKDLRAIGNEAASLRHETDLLIADQLDKRYAESVTQASIADAKRKQYQTYTFATPGEKSS